MTSSFSDFRGKVKDFINWNNPLLTGKEANYAGGMGSGQNSNYWVDALTGSDPAQNQIRTDANAHARGWQGYLADQLKAEGATSGWESRGYRDTQTLQRHQFDSDKAFLKLSDLRGTTDFTDPEGTNYTAAGDFQGRSYDSGTAFGLADTNNFNYGSNQTAYDNYGDLNLDSLSNDNYPNDQFFNKNEFSDTFIKVGASSINLNENFTAYFSNYGKINVDIFAPGVDIYSSVPNDKYKFQDGTSMASPVVSGIASLIMSYFPKLSAKKVKEIILKSGIDIDLKIGNLGSNRHFREYSKSGKLINAYNALILASKSKRK